MATIVDRDRTVALLRAEFAALSELGASLAPEEWARPTCLPGWSVQDQFAHLAGIEATLLGEPLPTADAAITGAPHVRNAVGQSNEAWVDSMRSLGGAEVLSFWDDVSARRLAALDGMDQAAFDAPSWTPAGPDESYGRFMRIRFYDCFVHEQDVREAVGRPTRDDEEHVAFALDEVRPALGFVVGKKAGMPEGTTVRIRLTGPAATDLYVAVTDRARAVDALDGEPTVGLTLPAPLFLRLTAGRADAAPLLGDAVQLEGDEALAHQLATHLAYTI